MWITASKLIYVACGQCGRTSVGSAILIEYVQSGKVNKQETNLLNHHIAISHSLLKDTLLFVAIGINAMWITFPRVILAIVVVWGVKILIKNKEEPVSLIS